MELRHQIGAVAAALVVVGAQAALAAPAAYPIAARRLSVPFARAMDACIPANSVTVVNPGAVNACPQTNTTTADGAIGMTSASLSVTRTSQKVMMRLIGRGFLPSGQQIGLQIVLRTTNTIGPPTG